MIVILAQLIRRVTMHLFQLTRVILPHLEVRLAISSGCDTYDTWLAGSEIVVALICFANMSSISGGIEWSLSDA